MEPNMQLTGQDTDEDEHKGWGSEILNPDLPNEMEMEIGKNLKENGVLPKT